MSVFPAHLGLSCLSLVQPVYDWLLWLKGKTHISDLATGSSPTQIGEWGSERVQITLGSVYMVLGYKAFSDLWSMFLPQFMGPNVILYVRFFRKYGHLGYMAHFCWSRRGPYIRNHV